MATASRSGNHSKTQPRRPQTSDRHKPGKNGNGATAKRHTADADVPAEGAHEFRIVRKRVASLKPSPENEQLYRRVADDPDLPNLVKSIQAKGLLQPLIVTADSYLVSGHCRHAALMRIGQVFCPCRVLPLRRDEITKDQYIALLREHNRQRNKTVAEQVREELIDIDPEQAHQRLREQRDKSVHSFEHNGTVDSLLIEGKKKRHGISSQKADHVKYIKQVVFEDREDYWPLSIRGVHYALLNYEFLRNTSEKLPYLNDDGSYQATSNLITRMRLNLTLPWDAFDDGTRPLKEFRAFRDVRQFVRQEVTNLLGGYWRDLLQSQPIHVELLCEKNTIYHIAMRVAQKYQIPISSGRGFNSIDPWHDLVQRYKASRKERLIVITLTDFDPEGQQIAQVGGRTLRDDFELRRVEIIPAGVTREQIVRYGLPSQNFAKEKSSNYKWFVERNDGDTSVYELEALNPEDLLRDLEGVVQSALDLDLFNREVHEEQGEAKYLEACRKTAAEALKCLGQ